MILTELPIVVPETILPIVPVIPPPLNKKDPNNVQDELANKSINQSINKLIFDIKTGELLVKNTDDTSQNPNEIVVDQIYKDGFFATEAQVPITMHL